MARVTPGTDPWGAALNEDLNGIEALANSALSEINGRLSTGSLAEYIRDTLGTTLVGGTNITVTPNDVSDTITISASGSGGGGVDVEAVRDTIGQALVGGSGINIAVNDASDTITITSTAVPTTRQVASGAGISGGGDLSANRTLTLDVEYVQDIIGSLIQAGDNVLVDYDDSGGGLTITANFTSIAASSIDSGFLSIERMPPGSEIVVDYYRNVYGAANAWPSTRPTARTDIVVNWVGPSDPGVIAIAGDILDIDPS